MSKEYCARLRGRTPWNKGIASGNHGNGFKKGQEPWNKGVPMSEKQKAKVSDSLKGRSAWNKGKPSPLKGIPRSHEVRAKISKSHIGIAKGRKVSLETRKKIGDAHRGARSYNWKGGITPADRLERIRFRNLLQQEIFSRDSYTCQICDLAGGYLQVDHIKRWSEYPELRFVKSNCRTVCMACHYYITFKKKLPKGVVWGHNLKRRITL